MVCFVKNPRLSPGLRVSSIWLRRVALMSNDLRCLDCENVDLGDEEARTVRDYIPLYGLQRKSLKCNGSN